MIALLDLMNIVFLCQLIMLFCLMQKTFLLLKIGNQHNSLNSAVTAIFDFCFVRSYVSIFSYHGRTKKSFKSLGIFQVMQGVLVSNN